MDPIVDLHGTSVFVVSGSLGVSRESQSEVNQQRHFELKVSQVHSTYSMIYLDLPLQNKL